MRPYRAVAQTMEAPTLIYCAGKNKRFDDIALSAGYRLGARLPATVYHPPYFADQDWRRPDRAVYMAALAHHRPHVATVLDWEREEQLTEVLDWAEEAAQHVKEKVLIIPKVTGAIGRLPRRIGGKDVVLGYSVPTTYGGTELLLGEFAGWPIHLLGGSPQAQMHIWYHLTPIAEVVSVDGNMTQKLANAHCQFWVPGTANYAHNRFWPTLSEADGQLWLTDGPYEAFRRSCENVAAAWEQMTRGLGG